MLYCTCRGNNGASRLQQGRFELHPAEFSPGAWVVGCKHTPGGNSMTPVNNRTWVFRLVLKDTLAGVKKGQEALLVFGLGSQGTIDAVKQLEKSTGCKAVAGLNNGGGHHVFLELWYQQFPDMKIWVTPTRVPQTSNGEYLRKEFKDRWELADNTTVPYHVYQLLKFFGSGDDLQVDCILHDQLYMYADKHANDCGFTWSSHKDFEENKIMPAMTFLSVVPGLIGTPAAHADEPLFYHKESGLVISGHQLEFQYLSPKVPFPEDLKQQGGFFYTTIVPKIFFVYGRFTSSLGETMTRLLDPKVHAAQYQEAMKWNFSYIATCHDIPTICGPLDNPEIMEGEGGLKGHLQRELGRTGEWTGEGVPGSWWPWRSPNIVYKVIQSEPKFVASMGPAPPLPLGGPGYDEIGMKK